MSGILMLGLRRQRLRVGLTSVIRELIHHMARPQNGEI